MILSGDKLFAALSKCPTMDLATAMTETLCFWEAITSLDPRGDVAFGVAPLPLSTATTAVFISIMDENDPQPYILLIATVDAPFTKVAEAWQRRTRERVALVKASPNDLGWGFIWNTSLACKHFERLRRALIYCGLVEAKA